MPPPVRRQETQYAERLSVPLRWWVQAAMMVAALWLAVAVAVPPLVSTAVALAAAALATGALVVYGGSRIRVGGAQFRAGRARIATELLGEVEVLDAEASRRAAGPEADARAYLLLRPYVRRCVRVTLADPADPTPYWLVASRRPEQLAAALRSGMSDRTSE